MREFNTSKLIIVKLFFQKNKQFTYYSNNYLKVIVHIHAREDDGTPSWRTEVFQEIKNELSEKLKSHLTAGNDPRLGDPSVFDEAPYYWSHGLETAGLPPYLWDPLTPEERQKKVDSVANALFGASVVVTQ